MYFYLVLKYYMVDSVFEFLHYYFIREVGSFEEKPITSFVIAFFKQLLFKKPSCLYKEDELFTLPLFFIEVMYILYHNRRNSFLFHMLLSLFLQLPHQAIEGDFSYLPNADKNAFNVLQEWESKGKEAFELSDEKITELFQQYQSVINNDLSYFTPFCLTMSLFISVVDYSTLFNFILNVDSYIIYYLVDYDFLTRSLVR